MLENWGVESLLFTSDSPEQNKDYGTTDGGKNVKKISSQWTIITILKILKWSFVGFTLINMGFSSFTFSFNDRQLQIEWWCWIKCP